MGIRTYWPKIRRIWIGMGVTTTALFVGWSLIAYRADAVGREASRSDSTIMVSVEDGVWTFEPQGTEPAGSTLVFFPGALVDPRAYAPLARAVAATGRQVLLVELPWRGAFGGADSSEIEIRIERAFVLADGPVILGGHSRGGVVAVRVAARDQRVAGLVLIGTSHPRDHDLRGLEIPVLKIVGTRDGLASPQEVRANASLLPARTQWVWIEGGNHSQFGWYGFQPMDRFPHIDEDSQRKRMVDAVLLLLNEG